MSLSPEQWRRVNNHELVGKAAAYYVRYLPFVNNTCLQRITNLRSLLCQAATEFTDYVESFGLPKTQVKAQSLMYVRIAMEYQVNIHSVLRSIDHARAFIDSNISKKGVRL